MLTPNYKCKNINSRTAAFNLLNTLSIDCIQNLNKVLNYIKEFSQQASWRTSKTQDWAISLTENEKSNTGFVGLKNLGCICYMNSVFQQLFMIPNLRASILNCRKPQLMNQAEPPNLDDDMLF